MILVSGVLNLLVLGSFLAAEEPDRFVPSAALWLPGSILVAAALAGVAVYAFAKWRRGRRARMTAAAEPAQRAALDAEQET